MRFIGLLAVVLGWSLLAQAESLDTVQVPVDGRGDAQRQDALAEGLEQMLVRLSGQRDVLNEAVASEAASRLDRWVTRYDYNTLDDGSSALQARYDVNGLMAFMAEQGASVWGMPRPGCCSGWWSRAQAAARWWWKVIRFMRSWLRKPSDVA